MDTLPRLGLVFAAWFAAAACVALSLWHLRRLTRFVPPTRVEVGERLSALATEPELLDFRATLREERNEAERALSLATLWPRSMARVSLASGTALAVTSLAKGMGSNGLRLPGGMLEFAGGFLGMLICTTFGRQAKDLAAELRQGWREAAKMADRK